ncbi:hypothetical protein VNI00_000019 [Paramarasmius palmivorus]|uniref:F-box domain-containing protein n=1 Tax=Paramarasmius palmivorus TaxID=297713 RepID=A0AAW0EBU3_9AGAR
MSSAGSSPILSQKCNEEPPPNAHPSTPSYMLHSEYNPSTLETAQILGLIEEEERLVECCDVELTRLEGLTTELKEKKLSVEQRIRERRMVVSAIRKVPDEIWDEIFYRVCTDPNYMLDISTSRSLESNITTARALCLSHTCSHWRRRTFSRPVLWSSMSVSVNLPPPGANELIELYLHNSGSHPLTMNIADVFRDEYELPEPGPQDMLEYFGRSGERVIYTLLRNVWRCSELSLHMHWSVLRDFGHGLGVSFPHLQTLNTDVDFSLGVDEPESWVWNALRNAPKLTTVVTHDVIEEFHIFPYSRLASLEISHEVTVDFVLDLLHHAQSLKTLKLWMIHGTYVPEIVAPTTPFTHPSLEHLEFTVTDFSQVISMFTLFTLSHLKRLEVTVTSFTGNDDARRAFLSMLRRSLALDVLYLKTPYLENVVYTDILAACPKVSMFHAHVERRSISIPSTNIIKFLQALTIQPDAPSSIPVLGPKLEKLRIYIEGHNACSPDIQVVEATVEFAESRSKTKLLAMCRDDISRLRSIDIDYHTWLISSDGGWTGNAKSLFDPSLQARVQALERDGITCRCEESTTKV